MPEAESAEAPKEESSLKTWATIIASVTALIGAITGLIHAFPKSGDAEAATPSATVAPTKPPPELWTLLWVPADCTKGAPASIAVGSCSEGRTLEWLNLQMDELRRAKKFGFDALPARFALKASDTMSGANFKLSVNDSAGQELYSVGVGYNVAKNTKDGGIHVSSHGQMVAEAWLGKDGNWYGRP